MIIIIIIITIIIIINNNNNNNFFYLNNIYLQRIRAITREIHKMKIIQMGHNGYKPIGRVTIKRKIYY